MTTDETLVGTGPLHGFLEQVRRSLLDQRVAMDTALNGWSAVASPECQLALDTDHLKSAAEDRAAQNRLYHAGWRAAFMMVTSVGDHVCAITDTANADAPRAFAHMTLARAALEAAGRVDYLLCPAGTVEDRVLRSAAAMIASAEEELRAVADFAGWNVELHKSADASARRRHTEVMALVGTAGIEVTASKGGRSVSVRWPVAGPGVSVSMNVTDVLGALLPTRPGAYRVGSGAAHSQPWVLDDDEAFNPQTNRLTWALDPVALAGSGDLGIAACVVILDAFAALLGADPSEERLHAHEREQAMSRLVVPLAHA